MSDKLNSEDESDLKLNADFDIEVELEGLELEEEEQGRKGAKLEEEEGLNKNNLGADIKPPPHYNSLLLQQELSIVLEPEFRQFPCLNIEFHGSKLCHLLRSLRLVSTR